MEYKKFNDLNISRLGMGNMRLPERDGHIDEEAAGQIIDRAIEGGVNYFDTAWMYHSFGSQKFLGEAMKKYPRDSFYLATKYHNGFDVDHKTMFEEQLKQLQTDYVDFYLLHGVGDKSGPRYIEEGAQKIGEGIYGKSITDPCLGWEDSKQLIYSIAETL